MNTRTYGKKIIKKCHMLLQVIYLHYLGHKIKHSTKALNKVFKKIQPCTLKVIWYLMHSAETLWRHIERKTELKFSSVIKGSDILFGYHLSASAGNTYTRLLLPKEVPSVIKSKSNWNVYWVRSYKTKSSNNLLPPWLKHSICPCHISWSQNCFCSCCSFKQL